MTYTLRHALRQDAGNVEIPTLEANDVIAQGEQRLHRRRMTAALAVVAAVAAIAVGSVLVTRADPNTQGPQPVAPPSSSKSTNGEVDPHGARPLVYADGSTVHVGDKTVAARDPVAFIDATDDGAVYEAMLDGTLWFTDGTTTSVIGTSGSPRHRPRTAGSSRPATPAPWWSGPTAPVARTRIPPSSSSTTPRAAKR